MPSSLAQIRQYRLEKVAKLREMGINPYPSKSTKEFSNAEILDNFEKFENKEVTLAGRLVSWREHGHLVFGHIQDQTGKIQLYIKDDEMEKTNVKDQTLGFEDLNLLDVGDIVEASGTVTKTQRGEISLMPKTLRLLTKSLRPLPEKWLGIIDQEQRYRRRYLDFIMNPERKELFIRKSKFWDANSEFLKNRGFLEVETPVLEHVTGGADARPFITHHNDLDQDFYLRISTELYQKRLLGGGFEKVFTLAPNFRNEGVSDEHLQEYYQIEWYWAYADFRDNMNMLKEMFRFIAKEVYGKTKFSTRNHTFDLADEWKEIDYANIIKEKLDVDIFNDTDEKMLKVAKEHRLKLDGDVNRQRLIDNLWKVIRKSISGPAFLINEPKFMSPLAKSRFDRPEFTERFHIIIAGSELGNGYSELNDPIDQLNRFKEQQDARDSGDDEAQMLDIDFVEMLEYGMPPASGYAHSERLFWFFENVTAREGTLFPLMKNDLENTTKEIYAEILSPIKIKSKKQDLSQKMVLVLNENLTGWQLNNTVGHICAILGSEIGKDKISSVENFETKDGKTIPANSQYPVITMSAKLGQMYNLLQKVEELGLIHLAYTKDMIDFNEDDKLSEHYKTQDKDNLEYLGIGIFGKSDVIAQLTKKFSLWK